MPLNIVAPPYPVFTDRDGTPLENGYVYLGEPGKDPETNPIQVFWDTALTIPAVQPIRTVYGYLSRNGTPAKLYANDTVSLTVKNSKQEVVFSSLTNIPFDPSTSARIEVERFTGNGTQTAFVLTSAPVSENNTQVYIKGVYQEKDGYSISGNTLTFTQAPPSNTSVEVVTFETYTIGQTDASFVSYTPAGVGAVQTTVQTKLRETVSVKDFGAVGDGVADDTAAIQAAILYAEGGAVYIPEGVYVCTSDIEIKAKTLIYGDGRNASTLEFTHTGKGLWSAFTPNTTNVADIKLRDFGITCTNASNTDGGYADICGTFIDLENIYIAGFKYGVILDQSELVTILRCEIINNIVNGSNIWIVNGSDYTPGNLPNFTNNITVRETQLNALSTNYALIYDQGGAGHWFENNNYNGGGNGIVAYAAIDLNITNGAFESQDAYCIVLEEGDPTGAGFFTPCQNVTVTGCSIASLSGTQPVGMLVNRVRGGQIINNTFSGFSSAAIELGTINRPTGVKIDGNFFLVGSAVQPPIVDVGDATNVQLNEITQKANTKCVVGGAVIGANTITPTSMFGISNGTYLYCINGDGSNGEIVQAGSVTGTTFDATFASTKSTGFLINGVNAP